MPIPKYSLSFIQDADLWHHVKDTVLKYRFKIDLKDFNKNLIDPIKLTFDAKVYQKTLEEIIETEVLRQLDKSNNNHIGYFHQNIFKYIHPAWTVPKIGYDMINEQEKIFIEMKNKHNTMNSSSSQKTYMRMQNTILKDPAASCYLVEVIAKNSQNSKWIVSLDGERVENEKIRRISIDQFYKLVTGKPYAFKELCEVLPQVIEDVLHELKEVKIENTVFEELHQIAPQLLSSLYLLSFEKYEGFNLSK
jgi:hypothetical protein